MSRFLTVFNLVGVLALAALAAAQWTTNGRLNREAIRLETIRLTQVSKIAEQQTTIAGCKADLDDFRKRLKDSEDSLQESESKLSARTAERDRLTAEVERFKANLDKWVAAVAARDQAMKDAGNRIRQLADERNAAIVKFNDLAGKYNEVVKDLNDARAATASGH